MMLGRAKCRLITFCVALDWQHHKKEIVSIRLVNSLLGISSSLVFNLIQL